MKDYEFLLDDVLKLGLLGEAAPWDLPSKEELAQAYETMQGHLRYAKSFELLTGLGGKHQLFGLTQPRNQGGSGWPEALALVFYSLVARTDSRLGLELLQSLACQKLLQDLGGAPQQPLAKKLAQGKAQGVLELIDAQARLQPTEGPITALPKGDHWQLEGKRMMFFSPSAMDKVFLVTAQTEQGRGLFVLDEGGVRLNQLQSDASLSPVEIEFGKDCQADLVAMLEPDFDIYHFSGMRRFLNLLSYAILDAAFERALHWAQSNHLSADWMPHPELQNVAMALHPMITGSLTQLMAGRNALRALLFHGSFYLDCLALGAEDKKPHFGDLHLLFELTFKYYAPKLASDLKRLSREVLGPGYFLTQDQHLLFQIDLLGGNALDMINRLTRELLIKDEGQAMQRLLEEFQSLDDQAAKSEDMKEAINLWRDFVGGLYLLQEDLKQPETDPRRRIYLELVAETLAQVTLAYQLIKEGLEAERRLVELGASLFHLEQESARDEDVAYGYGKILLALFYCRNILSQAESRIRLWQEGQLLPLEVLFRH